MNKIHKTVLIPVLLFCTCNLCAYGQEEETIQKFANFAKKVDVLNQANLCVLEQASRHDRDATESELRELHCQAQALTEEAMILDLHCYISIMIYIYNDREDEAMPYVNKMGAKHLLKEIQKRKDAKK